MSRASERRSSSSEDEGGGANWMDTYGDLVTLLLTFFVLLFAFSTIDAAKYEALANSFRDISIQVIPPLTPEDVAENPIPQIITKSKGETMAEGVGDETIFEDPETGETLSAFQILMELYESIMAYVGENEIDAEVRLVAEEYIVIVRFNDQVFFDSGEAVLRPESPPVLDHVIQMLLQTAPLYKKLSIEGHTDNVPIATQKYPSNWDLSLDRALVVLNYIKDSGEIEPNRLKMGAYGEFDPIATNDTAEGRAKNRRVDFIVEGFKPKPQS